MTPQACGAEPGRHACGQDLRFERNAHHVVGAGVEGVAQLTSGVQGSTEDDVRRRQLAPATDGNR
jgi:hypothetical protein